MMYGQDTKLLNKQILIVTDTEMHINKVDPFTQASPAHRLYCRFCLPLSYSPHCCSTCGVYWSWWSRTAASDWNPTDGAVTRPDNHWSHSRGEDSGSSYAQVFASDSTLIWRSSFWWRIPVGSGSHCWSSCYSAGSWGEVTKARATSPDSCSTIRPSASWACAPRTSWVPWRSASGLASSRSE